MKLYFLCVSLLLPNLAWAYLDPGSGNALVYLFISLFGAVSYFVKSAFWRVLSFLKGEKYEQMKETEIVIYSEGKNYWLTFKPIVKALIKRKVHFRYLTMDVRDPALEIDNEYMQSRFVGEDSAGFARIASTKAKVMLSTTPNIGCPGFPLPRPQKVECLAHVWHSICDTGFYHLGALDHYDVALTVGDWPVNSIRKIEQVREIKEKEVIPVGVPYLDSLAKSVNLKQEKNHDNKTILVAPSWGTKNCLVVYGMEFLVELAQKGYNIIVRPHPQSFKVETDFISRLQEVLIPFSNCRIDDSTDGSTSMSEADLLISDKSSIRFDFAFLYERPVLTLDIPSTDLSQYEASIIGKLWEEEQATKIGIRLTVDEKELIVSSVEQALKLQSSDLVTIREKSLVNFAHAGEAVADWLIAKTKK